MKLLLRVFLPLLFICLTSVQLATAKELPRWELGVAAGLLSMPEYMGSDERYTLPLASPYLIYRGDWVKADRDGIRGLLFDAGDFSLDLGFSFGLPVQNDNKARQGMPDLYLSGQVGPRLNWHFQRLPSGIDLSFHLPFRYAFDTKGNNLGWLAEPSFKIEDKQIALDGKLSARMDIGLLYATQRYNRHYYEVAPRYANLSRSAYEADSGLHSIFMKVSSTYQLSKKFSLGAFLHIRTLEPGVVSDSPLVKDDWDISAGIGFAWLFWQSNTLVDVAM